MKSRSGRGHYQNGGRSVPHRMYTPTNSIYIALCLCTDNDERRFTEKMILNLFALQEVHVTFNFEISAFSSFIYLVKTLILKLGNKKSKVKMILGEK